MNSIFSKEWLVTNGLGGYASGAISGANTRTYHGLLVAAKNPPTERVNVVGKIEERIFQNNEYYDLSTNQYPGTVYPKGYEYLDKFEQTPLATWYYRTPLSQLKKSIFMVAGSNTTIIEYKNIGNTSYKLEAHPLYSGCDYHSTFHENPYYDFYSVPLTNGIKIYPHNGSVPVFSWWTKGEFIKTGDWYKSIQLPMEGYRGLEAVTDYYRIGYLNCELAVGESVYIAFSTEKMFEIAPDSLKKLEEKRLNKLGNLKIKDCFYKDLIISGNQFLVKRASTNSHSIIAGYHWFTDWGRDTMISMRGLTIATGDQKASKSILSTFFKYLDKGMLPNRFPDHETDEILYNTMDASLWLFIAIYEYYLKFKDAPFIRKHLTHLQDIIDHHIQGTRYNIHVIDEGLLYGGEHGVQLTWMDAKVDGEVVTPRMGCPVEINALWYNALMIFNYLTNELSDKSQNDYKELAAKCKRSFQAYFINPEGTLYDVVIPSVSNDNSFRPNQIYAVSLPFSIVKREIEKNIVKQVDKKLLTNLGLRTLAPDDEKYKGHYGGSQWERDHDYHQGTAWPFLLGEYYTAFLKVNKNTKKARKEVASQLKPLKDHFYSKNGIHAISEIFDGTDPDEGRGTIQQAWSVGMLIKLYSDFKLYDLN